MEIDCRSRAHRGGMGKNKQTMYMTEQANMTNKTALMNGTEADIWPSRYCAVTKRASTPSVAARGTAINMPINPKSAPKTLSASKSQTGCNPTELPTSFGVK